MKAIIKLTGLSGLLLISLLAISCATTPIKIPDKYNFDNKLEQVKNLAEYRVDSWDDIDDQSLIIRANTNDYFLIILRRPEPSLPYSENIGITLTSDYINSGFDYIVVHDSGETESYAIQKIYKLKDREQANEIKKQLKSEAGNR